MEKLKNFFCSTFILLIIFMLTSCSKNAAKTNSENEKTDGPAQGSESSSLDESYSSQGTLGDETDVSMSKEDMISYAEKTDANPVTVTPEKTISIGETAEWIIEDMGARIGEMDFCLKSVDTFSDIQSAGLTTDMIFDEDKPRIDKSGKLKDGYILVVANVDVTNIDFPIMDDQWNVTSMGLIESYEEGVPALKLDYPYLINGEWEKGDHRYYDVTLERGVPRTVTMAWIVDTAVYAPENLYLAIGVSFGVAEGYSDPRKFYHLER